MENTNTIILHSEKRNPRIVRMTVVAVQVYAGNFPMSECFCQEGIQVHVQGKSK